MLSHLFLFPLHDNNILNSDTQKPKQRQAHSSRFHWALGSTLMGKGEEEQGMETRFSSKEPVISDIDLDRKRTETIHDQKEAEVCKAQVSRVS